MGGGLIRLHHRSGPGELLKLDLCWTFVTVDLAASEEQQADYTVFSTWAVTNHFDMLLLNVFRARLTEPKIIEKAVSIYKPTGHNGRKHATFIVEDNGLGLPIAQAMAAKGLPVLQVHIHRTDKMARTATAAIQIAGGRIYFPMHGPDYPWLEEFEKELAQFPMGEHDDQVDTLSLAAEGVFEVGFIGISGSEALKLGDKEAHEIMENKTKSQSNINMGKRFFKRN